ATTRRSPCPTSRATPGRSREPSCASSRVTGTSSPSPAPSSSPTSWAEASRNFAPPLPGKNIDVGARREARRVGGDDHERGGAGERGDVPRPLVTDGRGAGLAQGRRDEPRERDRLVLERRGQARAVEGERGGRDAGEDVQRGAGEQLERDHGGYRVSG